MKKTEYMIACKKTSTRTIYRLAMEDENGRYFITWNNKHIDVTKEIKNHHYVPAWAVR